MQGENLIVRNVILRIGRCSSGRFAAFRPVKHYPDGEIFAEILEPVRFSAGRKNEITGLCFAPGFSVAENSTATRDDVKFIARVRSLRINQFSVGSTRNVQFDLQRAVLKQCHLPGRSGNRQSCKCFRQTDVRPFSTKLRCCSVNDGGHSLPYAR